MTASLLCLFISLSPTKALLLSINQIIFPLIHKSNIPYNSPIEDIEEPSYQKNFVSNVVKIRLCSGNDEKMK